MFLQQDTTSPTQTSYLQYNLNPKVKLILGAYQARNNL